MARRVRQQAPRASDGVEAPVGPPWQPMDPVAEDRARREYLALRARAGESPVVYAGEKAGDVKTRIGALPKSLWWAARFDPDPAFRRRALVAAVDHVRAQVVEHIRWLELAPPLGGTGVGDGFATFDLVSGCDYVHRARASDPLGGLADQGGDATAARLIFDELAADAAMVGVFVTEGGVVDREAGP